MSLFDSQVLIYLGLAEDDLAEITAEMINEIDGMSDLESFFK